MNSPAPQESAKFRGTARGSAFPEPSEMKPPARAQKEAKILVFLRHNPMLTVLAVSTAGSEV